MGNSFSFTNLKGNHYHKIIDNLYIGDGKSMFQPFFEEQDKVIVINATTSIPFNKKVNSTKNYRVPIEDDLTTYSDKKMFNVLPSLTKIIQYYLKKDYVVLVHCVAGRQRSCAIVAAYLMQYKNMTFKKAVYLIKSQRPFAFFGNINFRRPLIAYENLLNS